MSTETEQVRIARAHLWGTFFSERGMQILQRSLENEIDVIQECLADPAIVDRADWEKDLETATSILTHLKAATNG